MSRFQLPQGGSISSTLADLHAALESAVQILRCPICPTTVLTAAQNLYQLATLLTTIVSAVHSLLTGVDANALSRGQSTQWKCLGISLEDYSSTSEHQFRIFFRRHIRDVLLGQSSDLGNTTIFGVLNQFEKRQTAWHEDPYMYEEQARLFGKRSATVRATECEGRVCQTLIQQIRNSINTLEL